MQTEPPPTASPSHPSPGTVRDVPVGVSLPRFIVFEGVDGVGKTTFARALARYYVVAAPTLPLYTGSFPGLEPGTLGEWVYNLHHDSASLAPRREAIAPAALQLLHVAAHVDAIVTRIAPVLAADGAVILDRYWWSTYAYARCHLPADHVWPLVEAERPFWRDVPPPTVVYLTRSTGARANEPDAATRRILTVAYREVLDADRRAGVRVRELDNDDTLDRTWATLLAALTLPHRALGGVDV